METLSLPAVSCHRWVVLIAAVCLASGCDVARVNDVRLANVEIVDPTQQSIPAELKQWNPQGRLVKLSFVTKTNVRDTARKFGLHLRADTYLCGNRSHELAKWNLLFDRDGAIADNPAASTSSDGTELWLYVAERSGPRRDIETGKLTIPAYDLAQQPTDICVQLHGRNMAMEGFSSNLVKVASEELTRALAQDR